MGFISKMSSGRQHILEADCWKLFLESLVRIWRLCIGINGEAVPMWFCFSIFMFKRNIFFAHLRHLGVGIAFLQETHMHDSDWQMLDG